MIVHKAGPDGMLANSVLVAMNQADHEQKLMEQAPETVLKDFFGGHEAKITVVLPLGGTNTINRISGLLWFVEKRIPYPAFKDGDTDVITQMPIGRYANKNGEKIASVDYDASIVWNNCLIVKVADSQAVYITSPRAYITWMHNQAKQGKHPVCAFTRRAISVSQVQELINQEVLEPKVLIV